MKTTGWAATFLAVAVSLQGYAVAVTPPDLVSTMLLMMLATPPALGATWYARRAGAQQAGSTSAQAIAMGLGFVLMCVLPWWAGLQLDAAVAQLQSMPDTSPSPSTGKWAMVLGPVAWCAALGWVAGSRSATASVGGVPPSSQETSP